MRLSMNTVNAAVTQHEGEDIVSFAAVGGKVFAAGPGGLYQVTGTLDDGDDIAASIVFGEQDFGSDKQKRPVAAYVEAKTAMPLTFHVYTPEGDYDYLMNNDSAQLVVHKTPLGKGIKAKRLQYGVSGHNIEELPEVTVLIGAGARRV